MIIAGAVSPKMQCTSGMRGGGRKEKDGGTWSGSERWRILCHTLLYKAKGRGSRAGSGVE